MTLSPNPNNTQNNISNNERNSPEILEAQQTSQAVEEDDVENFLKSLDNLEPEGVSQDPTLPTPELSMATSNLSSDREELEESVNLDSIPDFEIPATTAEVEEDLNPQSVDDQQDVDILADRSLPHFESIDSSEAHDSRALDQEELSFEEDPPELAPNEQDTSHLDPLSPKTLSPEQVKDTENLETSESKNEITSENELGLINEETSHSSKIESSNLTETEVENNTETDIQEELKLVETPIVNEIQEKVEEIQLEADLAVDKIQEKVEEIKLEEDSAANEVQQSSEEKQPSPQQTSPTQVASNVDSLFGPSEGLDSFFDQSYAAADPSASFFESFTPQGADDPFSQISGSGEQTSSQDQSSYTQQAGSEATYDQNTGAEYQEQYNQYDPNYAYDPNQQGYENYTSEQDPSAGYDYSQYYSEQGYDPNSYYDQTYDPNNPQSYDPNAYYDPSNPQQYDPSAYYDPNNPQSYDQSAYYDPNNPQSYDPNAYYDPNAAQQYDPNTATYDPNAAHQYDPNTTQQYDPNAQTSYDPNSYYDQSAYEAYDQSEYYTQDTQQTQTDASYYADPNQHSYDTTQYQTQDHQAAFGSEDQYSNQANAVEYDTQKSYQEPLSQYADNPNLTPRVSAKDTTDYFNQIVEPTSDQTNVQSENYSTNFTETKDIGPPPMLPVGQANDDPATLSVFESNTPDMLSPGQDSYQYGIQSHSDYNLNSEGFSPMQGQYTDGQDSSATITSVVNEQNTGSPFMPTNIASPSIPTKNQYSSFDGYSSTQQLNVYESTSREIQASFGYQPPQSSDFEYSSITPNMEPEEIEIRAKRAPYPIIAFGFGGKLITSFYRKIPMYSGDAVAENVTPGEIKVSELKTHLPPSDNSFIGPLWTGKSKHHKKVETQAIDYIKSYLELSNQGGVSSTEEGELRESRNILLKILIIMIETQGKLFGDDAAEAKLQALFESNVSSPPISAEVIESPTRAPNDTCLPEVFDLLQKGSRSEASKLAADNGHWAHALIISSCAGKEVWQDTIRKFIQNELKSSRNIANPDALGTLYGLFAGLGKQAIKDMFPASETSPTPPWKDILKMVCANRTPGDLAAIVTLGDQLLAKGNVYAAHICYLLSSPTAVLGGVDTPSVRWILAGSSISHLHFKDWESIRWTEIIEFAQSLTSNSPGIPHLQSYKINYAWNLLDYGEIDAAASYCEAIINIVKAHTKGSPHFHSSLINQVKFLSDRIAKCGGSKGAASEFGTAWLTGKLSTPSFDSLMSAVDRRLNQLITGDDDYSSSNKSSEIKELKPGPTVFNYGAGSTGASSPYGSTSGGYMPNHLSQKQGGLSSPFGHHSTGDQDSVPFINLDQQFAPQTSTPAIGSPSKPPPTINQIDDDDDLGFGNKSLKKKPEGVPSHQSTPSEGTIKAPKEENTSDHSRSKSSGGSSMFGSLFKVFTFGGGSNNSNDASPSRVKANLGEESSFYYDEKEKRWVNKNAPASESAPAPTPPPPKSATSSLGPSMPPMARAAAPPFSHSTPATTGNSPSTASPPSGMSTPGGPPTAGRRGGRKALKNRYVDVMNN